MEEMHLQQLIIIWWKHEAPPKLKMIDQAIPELIIVEVKEWPSMIIKLKNYMPSLHYQKVTWNLPKKHKLKCNTDGACRGN
ncbi:hypothetical protein H5410_057214 [Solanum commersonii]|uniref:Uncharacterized protein n=1 Tax=Solanum commersonii TaxID=4109 RepID=A0A9J5WPY7_SOLCO|nr:hypothetical protein H5410_057214 [Solanum commersonii]